MFEKFDVFIKLRPKLFLMVTLITSAFGILAIKSINFKTNFANTASTLAVEISAYGFDPYKVEELLINPIEEGLSTVNGIKNIRSISEQGKAMIFIELSSSNNVDKKILSIQDSIELSSANFPKNVHKPIIHKHDPSKQPYMVVSFQSNTLSINDLREVIEKNIKKKIESVEGVSQAIIAGGNLVEIEVGCDPNKMEAYHISIRDILNKIQDIHRNYSLGKLSKDKFDFTISVKEKLIDIEDIGNIPFYSRISNELIKLNNIALIQSKEREDSTTARVNGEERVSLFIYSSSDINSLSISSNVRSILDQNLPETITKKITQDEGEYLKDIYFSMLSSVFFLILFSIITNIKFMFNLVYLIKTWILFIILALFAAFTLRILNLDLTYFNYLGIIGALTTLLLFKKIHDINSILIGFFVSFLVLLSLLNLVYASNIKEFILFYFIILATSILKRKIIDENFEQNIIITFKIEKINNFKKILIRKFNNTSANWISKKTEFVHLSLYSYPIGLFFLVTLGLIYSLKTEIAATSNIDRKEILAFLEFPSGTSFEHTNLISKRVEEKISTIEEVSEVVSKVDPAHSVFFLHLEDGIIADGNLLSKIRSDIGSVEDGQLFFATNEGSKYFQEIEIDILGFDDRILENLANTLAARIKTIDGVEESILKFKSAREELKLFPKNIELAASRLRFSEVGDQLQLAIQGGVAVKINSADKEIDVRVRYLKDFRSSLENLKEIRIKNRDDDFVPIESIASGSETKVPVKIYHKNKIRIVTMLIKLNELGYTARDRVYDFLESYSFPDGYRWESEQYFGEKSSKNFHTYFIFLIPILILMSFYSQDSGINTKFSKSIFILSSWFFLIFLVNFLFPGPLPVVGIVGVIHGILQFSISQNISNRRKNKILSLMFLLCGLLLIVGGEDMYIIYLFFTNSFLTFSIFELNQRIMINWEKSNNITFYEFIINSVLILTNRVNQLKSQLFQKY
ncbi:efflux RND transporter permease subunit [Leptospira yanagawae]|uniref:Efflux RND transporter permease subunit n=1 Tax=Leptospira yanagawae TaxID=293069 RepID=A0ABY2M3U0_9LEPT|nr:efflux RND transporter permease subunit [Leptospira yanagawae]TGL23051.1 efflux RND transporter permease subunit [Leptospira yanagawae]